MAQCAQFYTIPIFQQSCQMIYVASDMLKGQRVAFVLIILLMLYSIKRNPSEWGADQMCTNTNAQIHEGQRAGRKEGYLIGLYTSTFQRKNRYYLCQQGLRSSY